MQRTWDSRAGAIGAVTEMNPRHDCATTGPPGPVRRHRRAPASGTARAWQALAGLAKFGPLLLGSAERRPRARRRAVVLTISGLVAGAAIAAALGVAHVSERLTKGRPGWIVLAVGFELLSALGFVATFQLVFGEWLPSRKSFRMGLAVCAATILAPAGGLLAIGLGAKALRKRGMPGPKTACRAVAFLIITNAPNLIVLGVLGMALGAGLVAGPQAPIVTVVPAAIALSAIGLTLLVPTLSHRRVARVPLRLPHRIASTMTTQIELGVIEARALLSERSWKLSGALAYYACDNAVLWATFKAFGHTYPPIATLVMAYLIGSAASSLPLPAGLGVVESGMIGLLVLYGAPAVCAGVAVLAYRAVSTGVPLALGGIALLTLRQRAPRNRPLAGHRARPAVLSPSRHA
jgi:uncharacterized membrane protein YbhN (UPF0104 family)